MTGSLDSLGHIAVALALGLLIGAERERSHPKGIPGGVRTFALLATTGAVAIAVDPLLAAAGLVAGGAVIAVGYRRTSRTDPGATTEIAALATYVIGALAWRNALVAVAVGITVAVVLASKGRLHHFVRDVVTDAELEDALKLFVIAFVILPLLPSGAIGPYDVLDPRRIWTIVVILAAVNFVGYIATRALGTERGLAVTGLAGGFVSASATTGAMAARARVATDRDAGLAAAVLASVSTLLQLGVVTAYVNRSLLVALLPAIVLGIAAMLAVTVRSFRRAAAQGPTSDMNMESDATTTTTRAFLLRPALILAVVLTVATLLARWGVDVFGPSGAVPAAGLAGIADSHAGAMASATLLTDGAISQAVAIAAVGAALATNLVVKVALAFVGGGASVGRRYVVLMAAPVAIVATAMALAA